MPRLLDLRVVLLGVVALGVVTFDHSRAHFPATQATRVEDGKILVETAMIVPETCWSVLDAEPVRPAGVAPVAGASPVTLRLARATGPCGAAMTPLKARFTVDAEPGATSMMLYVVDADGRLMKAERKLVRG